MSLQKGRYRTQVQYLHEQKNYVVAALFDFRTRINLIMENIREILDTVHNHTCLNTVSSVFH